VVRFCLLSGLYLVCILGVALLRPQAAPKLPADYGPQTWGALWGIVLKACSR
jgi:hypothetical protein